MDRRAWQATVTEVVVSWTGRRTQSHSIYIIPAYEIKLK